MGVIVGFGLDLVSDVTPSRDVFCVTTETLLQYVDWVEDELRDTLRKDYRGIDAYEVESLLWNYVMLEVLPLQADQTPPGGGCAI